jgi:hypothetical protein
MIIRPTSLCNMATIHYIAVVGNADSAGFFVTGIDAETIDRNFQRHPGLIGPVLIDPVQIPAAP